MENVLLIFFWISVAILFYCYLGYGLLLLLLTSLKQLVMPRKKESVSEYEIPVTLIITAYNEELILEQKIQNTLAIDYPLDKLRIIIITDGSADDSAKLVLRYPFINLLHQPERKGKYAAIKRAMKQVQTPVVVFSDANSLLNAACIKMITRHYSNAKTGGVAGEKRILHQKNISAIGEAEGMYWQYESLMKKLDARLNTVTGAAGELFSIRTALFKELNEDLILDDFVISMQICLQGYKIDYEPGAYASELPSVSLAEEEKRKVRIAAGAYQSIGYLKKCLNIFKHPLLSFQYISRRLLRWVFCPVLLVVLLITNMLLVSFPPAAEIYYWGMYAQIIFYVIAFTGWLFVRSGKRTGFFTIPFYFLFMNYCLLKGFVRFTKGRQSVLWEKSLRQTIG